MRTCNQITLLEIFYHIDLQIGAKVRCKIGTLFHLAIAQLSCCCCQKNKYSRVLIPLLIVVLSVIKYELNEMRNGDLGRKESNILRKKYFDER